MTTHESMQPCSVRQRNLHSLQLNQKPPERLGFLNVVLMAKFYISRIRLDAYRPCLATGSLTQYGKDAPKFITKPKANSVLLEIVRSVATFRLHVGLTSDHTSQPYSPRILPLGTGPSFVQGWSPELCFSLSDVSADHCAVWAKLNQVETARGISVCKQFRQLAQTNSLT